jgi:RecA-family ATPase
MDVTKFIELVQQEHDKMVESAQPDKGNYDDLLNLEQKGWLLQKPPQREYLFNYLETFDEESGFLPKGKVCMIASPGGCGKTFILAHCALAAATGSNWLNAKSTGPVKVLFIAAEEDEAELWNRFYKMAKGLEIEKNKKQLQKALCNIFPLALRGKSQSLIDEKGRPRQSYVELKSVIEKNPEIQLVILDPAIRFMGPETETNNAAATDWVNLLDALTLIGGKPTVLVAHHTNKTALRPVGNDKKPVFDQSMCRGASALVDGFRWVLGLQRSQAENESKTIYVKLLKTNYCKLGDTLEFFQDFEKGGILTLKGSVKLTENSYATEKKEDYSTSSSDDNTDYPYTDDDDDEEPVENWGGLV